MKNSKHSLASVICVNKLSDFILAVDMLNWSSLLVVETAVLELGFCLGGRIDRSCKKNRFRLG